MCRDYLRKPWLRQADETAALESIPADDTLCDSADDSLLEEVMRLPPKYKDVILLYYYHEQKISEISAILNIPEGTVSVRLKRAREALKKNLKGWD